jgi:6-phosphofructokinase 1
VYGIRDAYRGLVDGGESIFPLDWVDVSWSFREGGTFLGSARFTDLVGDSENARELKLKVLLNLKSRGITGLVVIGGDGSLTGAEQLWAFFRDSRHRSQELRDGELAIVGIPGSIGNDIAFTDMSIGVDTTLNTIVECIDKLRDTATSHRRVSIVEVMGRLRGYLAVMSGLATGADRVYIREENISQNELHTMLSLLQESFHQGQRAGVIIRSEGANCSTGFLKETIALLLEPKREVRETVLGHLQRGGNPTGFERVLATRMGVRAVQFLEDGIAEPQMTGLTANTIEPVPVHRILQRVREPAFREQLSPNTRKAFFLARKLEEPPHKNPCGTRIAVLTDGNNVSGMNLAIRALARLAINEGIETVGIKGGFAGLVQGSENMLHLSWSMLELKGILRRAGTLLGVSSNGFPTDGKDFLIMRKQVEQFKLHGLVAIGDARTYNYAQNLSALIQIPIVGIPAALCCNVVGTDWVIGMDSALNDLLRGIDRASDAANVQKKIFIVHIKGEYCACLVKLAGLAGGVELLIVDEGRGQEAFKQQVQEKIRQLQRIVGLGKSFATILFFSENYEEADDRLRHVARSLREAGITPEPAMISLETSLGGIIPTAFDRILAQRLGEQALITLRQKMESRDHSFHTVGITGREISAIAASSLKNGFRSKCSAPLTAELAECIDLMALPGSACIGMGGDIDWTDTGDAADWQGIWTCKQCGSSQNFSFSPKRMLCVYCSQESCHNYGYIRISRRL